MGTGWTRVHPFVELSAADMSALLTPALGEQQVASLTRLSGGLANTNYKVELAGREHPVVVRIYTRDPDACDRDNALFHLVRATVPVPELLFADASRMRCQWPYAVMAWVDGVPLADVFAHGTAGELHEAGYASGTVLAAIGVHRFPRPGFLRGEGRTLRVADHASDSLLAYIEACLRADRIGERVDEPFLRRVREFVTAHGEYLTRIEGQAALVHGDFKGGNILVSRAAGRWAVAAVLDWEFAFAGPPVFDLGQLLRYSDRVDPAFERGVIAGFTAAGGELAPNWKRTARLVDFANLCDFLARPQQDAARSQEVQELLAATMDRWVSYPA